MLSERKAKIEAFRIRTGEGGGSEETLSSCFRGVLFFVITC